MGHLVAQALLDGLPFGEPDLGLTNPGGLRAEFYFEGDPTENPANTDGVVTYAEANSVLPFGNTIVTAELTGADLIQVFDQQWQTAETPEDPTPSRPYLALGASDNVEVVADPTAETGEHIVSLKIDGEEVDPEATYSVATFNFLAEGNDNFRAFRNATVTDSGISDAELFRDYLADSSPIEPDHAQRQMFVDTDGELTAGTTETIEVTRLGLTSLGSPVDPSVTVTAGEQELGTFPVTDRAATIELELPESLGGQSITLTSALGVTAELAVAAPEPTAVVKAKRNPKGPLKAGKKKLKVTVKVKVDGEPASGKVVLSGAGVDKKVKLNKKGKAVTRVGPFDEKGVQVITVSYGDASDILRFKVR